MDVLFDMRLDGELDREAFDLKRNEIQVKITRLNNRIVAHEKADSSFDNTILGLLDIATQAGYVFEKSSNITSFHQGNDVLLSRNPDLYRLGSKIA